MSSNDSPFKRHSRAQGIALVDTVRSRSSASSKLTPTPPPPTFSREGPLRKSRVLHARQTPSWIQSKGEAVAFPEVCSASLHVESLASPRTDGIVALNPKNDASRNTFEQKEGPLTLPQPVDAKIVPKSTWLDYVNLGTLVQGGREMLICCSRNNQQLFMLKDVGQGLADRMVTTAALEHRHIALASFSIDSESTSYIAFPYIRHTLEELLHIHVTMDENHIRAIALPVYQALRYLHENNFFHGSVNVQSIRVCGRLGTVVLGDCDACEEVVRPTSTDIEGLGIVLLHCMGGSISDLTPTRVREYRALNKVFGLTNPDKWSEHKQLVDFIDDVFSDQRHLLAKFKKPHIYVAQGEWNPEVLVSLAELASLECFTLWHAP